MRRAGTPLPYCSTSHDVETGKSGLSAIRVIYRAEGIRIDKRKLTGRKIRAAYFCDGGDASVLLNGDLPKIPRLFSLGHELKHHLCDRQALNDGRIQCGDCNAHEMIERYLRRRGWLTAEGSTKA